MIGSLRGSLLERLPRRDVKDPAIEVLIECGGVGYRATMTVGSASRLGELGTSVFVHTYTHVREDALVLFGFGSREERDCFSALISTHGIGPSVALAILATHGPSELMRVVYDNDIDALCSVPGIGKKTAAKLMVELQSKLDFPIIDIVSSPEQSTTVNDARSEVRAALVSLGYSTEEIRNAMSVLPADETSEVLLREALRRLAVSA